MGAALGPDPSARRIGGKIGLVPMLMGAAAIER